MTIKRKEGRLVSAAEAVQQIPSSGYVVFSHAAAIPQEIPMEMVKNKERFCNLNIYHMLGLGNGEYMLPDAAGHFRHITNFVGGNSRKAIAEHRADFIPCFFYEVPRMFRDKTIPVDVAVIQVSRPNHEGLCSFGLSCDYTKPATKYAKIVIAEMNSQMPFVAGDNFIHISDIDYVVETSKALYEIPAPSISSIEQAIGSNCASLIEDGSTLQLGIGAIPDAVLMFLNEKNDLGIHTEMFSDGAVELVKSGVLNGSRKTLHKGKMVATFLMGTKKLYDFVNNNPDVELYPVDYVNDPYIISKNDKMVSINSCIEVDLMGQVNSETIGHKQFSGTGGQVDYVRGARLSKGGISIMAMPSTTSNGKVSKIVSRLSSGSAVTTLRNEVDYVVTEYGIAKLSGKTLRERAELLINIAHPDFRESLRSELLQNA